MAEIIVTFKIMPEGVDVNYDFVKEESDKIISSKGRLEKEEIKPIAFGLKSLILHAVFPEAIGSGVDDLAEKIGMLSGVDNCEVIDVRRTIEFWLTFKLF